MATSVESAKKKAEEVLEPYQHDIWDWYDSEGGRFAVKPTIINYKKHPKLFKKRIEASFKAQQDDMKFLKEQLKNEIVKLGGEADIMEKLTNGTYINLDKFLSLLKTEQEQFEINGKRDFGMLGHYLVKLGKHVAGYAQEESFLLTDGNIWGSPAIPKDVWKDMDKKPEDYWLVTVDVHN